MKRPLILKAAQMRLGEIWDYTVDKWGEEQANSYLGELASCMEGLAGSRPQWRSLKDRRLVGIFFVRCQHHFIFFRSLNDRVAVVSVLHESMDIVQRLREEIQR